MKINAEVKEIRFRNDSNGWTVILCTDTDKNGFSAVGVMPNINSGEQAELEGTWTEHPIYGRQFRVDSYRSILPKGRQALLAYLSSGFIKGIRESTARLIVDRFGEDTFDIIKNHPEQLIKISGIGPKKAQQIHESYLEKYNLQDIVIGMQELGLSVTMARISVLRQLTASRRKQAMSMSPSFELKPALNTPYRLRGRREIPACPEMFLSTLQQKGY